MLCWFYKTAYLCNRKTETSTAKRGREPEGEWTLSSAGSERLPYKQRVGGSNPSATTMLKHLFQLQSDNFQTVQKNNGSSIEFPFFVSVIYTHEWRRRYISNSSAGKGFE